MRHNRHYEKVGDKEPVDIEDDLPFELPAGWAWARIGSISQEPKYGTSKKSNASGVMPVLRMGNITRKGTIDYSDLVYSSDEQEIEKYRLEPGDVIFNRTNSKEWVGKTAYYDGAVQAIYAGYLVRFRPLLISARYVNHAMCSPYERDWCNSVKTDGVNQSNINVQKLKAFLIPVPPLAEQRRIVAALDEYLGLVDSVEADEAALEELAAKARAKVLDLAIRGKLVDQDPADEPASELLARVRAEKLAMVERGELKAKDVAGDSVIWRGEDNSYYEQSATVEPASPLEFASFEIPASWAWATLSSLCIYLHRGKSPKYTDECHEYPVFAQKCNQPTHITLEKVKFADPSTIDRYEAQHWLRDGDIVVNSTGTGTLGRVGYFRNSDLGQYNHIVADSHVAVIRCASSVSARFCWHLLRSRYGQQYIFSNQTGSTNQKELPASALGDMPVPVPPASEQERVSAAVDSFLNAIDSLTRL